MSEEKSGLKKDIDISQFTVRINKNIDDVVVDYANKYGMSRNSLVAFIIGEWVENKKKQDRQEEMQFNKFIEFISNPDVIKNNSSLYMSNDSSYKDLANEITKNLIQSMLNENTLLNSNQEGD